MAKKRYCCAICGVNIRALRLRDIWLKEFRAIYSNPDGYFISGVGYFRFQGILRAPTDPTKRYDDNDHASQLTANFDNLNDGEGTSIRDVYVTHHACWSLLQEAVKPNEISPQRFVDICESLPLHSFFCPFWGHTFGDIYDFDPNAGYPWEKQLEGETSESEASRHVLNDPYSLPEIPEILTRTAHGSSDPTSIQPMVQMTIKSQDCFSRLPWEIREIIALNLPIRDVLNLRQSSRSFYSLLDSSPFWASRFEPGGDRAFLFEKRNVAGYRDWLSLHRHTTYSQSSHGLKHRRRIWNLIENIVPLLNLPPLDDSGHESMDEILHETPDESVLCLVEANILDKSIRDETGRNAAGNEYDQYFLNQGCQLFQTQYTSLPHDLTSLALSFVALGDSGYLCGIRATSQDRRGIQLGYHSENTVIFDVERPLREFILAVHSQGVRAIQILDDNGKSQWFGFPKDTPVTERLAVDGIVGVQVGIDAFKIVSIGVRISNTKAGQSASNERYSSLRKTALWYPSVPSHDLFLNERCFVDNNPDTPKYCPIHWIHFGGPEGAYLSSVAQISVSDSLNPSIIGFQYRSGEGPASSVILGRPRVPFYTGSMPVNQEGFECIESVQFAMHTSVHNLKIVMSSGEVYGGYEQRRGLWGPVF